MPAKKTGKKVAPKKAVTKGKKKAPASKKGKKVAPKKAKAPKAKKAAPKVVKPKVVKPKKQLSMVSPKGAHLTKGELFNNFMCATDLNRKECVASFEALSTIGHKELVAGRKFVIPGMARFVVKSRPAKPAREGRNPFTGENMMFKARPASKTVKAYTLKAFKTL